MILRTKHVGSTDILCLRSYDDNATEAKKAKMIGMYPHRDKTGFQVTFLRVFV